jgi:hypothetical protein
LPCDYFDRFRPTKRTAPVGTTIIIVIVLLYWATKFDQLQYWRVVLEAVLHATIVAASVRLVYEMAERARTTLVKTWRLLAATIRALAKAIGQPFRWLASRVEIRVRLSLQLGRT